MLESLKRLPQTVWLIGLISLINDAASDMIYPLIPLYLASVLMAGPKTLGLIEGVAEATASLLKLFSGVIVDRTRRSRIWIIVGYGLAGFGRPLIALVGSWPFLLVIRFADRVGKGLRSSPRDALLAGSAGADMRGLAFGLHRAMDNAGAVLGPVVAAMLLGSGMALRDIFLWSIVPAVLCLLLALKINEPVMAVAPPAVREFDWRLRDMPPVFRRYLVVVAIFTLGNSSNMFLLLRAQELGVPQAQIPLLWAAVSAIAMVFSTPISALSDRWGRGRMLFAGYIAYGIFYYSLGIIGYHGAGAELYALFAFYGLFMASTEGVEKALVADLAPEGRRGTAFGWFNLTAGIMLLPASVLFGWLYEDFSALSAFLVSFVCSVTAALLLLIWVRPEQRENCAGRAPVDGLE